MLIKLNTWSCLEISVQDEVTLPRLIRVFCKGGRFQIFWNKLNKSIEEEIKSRLKSGNVCYHSVQNLLSSSLIFKTLKM